MSTPKRQIQMVVRKVSLHEPPSEREFWLSQTPQERIAAVEEIRREFHGYDYATEPRLQRILTIKNSYNR